MAVNAYARLDQTPLERPVTLPRFSLKEPDVEAEAREATARAAEIKTIRAGRDAWQAIGRAESLENWHTIGLALQVGREFALRATGANAPMGAVYSRAFCHGQEKMALRRCQGRNDFGRSNSYLTFDAISTWREMLPERQRREITHPQSMVTPFPRERWPGASVRDQRGRLVEALSGERQTPIVSDTAAS